MPDLLFSIPAAPVLVPAWVGAVAVSLAAVGRRRRLAPGRVLAVVAACTYVAAVLDLTLFPFQVALGAYGNQADWYDKFNWIPVLTIDPVTFALNVVMTLPLAALASLLVRVDSARAAARLGFGFSLAIELVQLVSNLTVSSGRTADVNDLIANTLGAVLGWLLLRRLRRLPWVDALIGRLSLVPTRTRDRAGYAARA